MGDAAETTDGLWPLARWEGDCASALEVIVARVSEGETLKEVCAGRGWPRSVVARWLGEDAERKARYDAALGVWADELAQATVGISDVGEDVARDKLRIDTRLKLAARWDRARYGEHVEVKHTGGVPVLNIVVVGGGGGVVGMLPGTEVARIIDAAQDSAAQDEVTQDDGIV